MHSLWWLQSPGIITCNSVLVPLAHANISMLGLAPRFIFLVHGRPFICKKNKCIQFRKHHILMNIGIVTKKRKYLIIQLACTSSSNWSSMYSSRGCGCNNGIDVLITRPPRPCFHSVEVLPKFVMWSENPTGAWLQLPRFFAGELPATGPGGLWLQEDGCCSKASWVAVEVSIAGNAFLAHGWQTFAHVRGLGRR